MAVKIKLKRIGKIRTPQYRIIVADSRTKRDGRAIEEIGIYQPQQDPSIIRVDSERAQYWLSVGAQPTAAVAAILRVTGDLQRFRGDQEATGTLRVAEPKPDRQAVFNAAVADAEKAKSEGAPRAGTKSKSRSSVGDNAVEKSSPAAGDPGPAQADDSGGSAEDASSEAAPHAPSAE